MVATDHEVVAGRAMEAVAPTSMVVAVAALAGASADEAAILEQLRAAFANETRQLLTAEQVEALLLQKAESDAESLQGALHRKADVAALEYALEDKLDCADAEAILAEVAALKQELGRIEMTAVTSAQSESRLPSAAKASRTGTTTAE